MSQARSHVSLNYLKTKGRLVQMVNQNGGKFESLLKIVRLSVYEDAPSAGTGDSYDMKLPFFCRRVPLLNHSVLDIHRDLFLPSTSRYSYVILIY